MTATPRQDSLERRRGAFRRASTAVGEQPVFGLGARQPAAQVRELLRVWELATMLGVTSGRVYQLIAEGEVPATRVGRALRIPKPALEAWLQRCTADASQSA